MTQSRIKKNSFRKLASSYDQRWRQYTNHSLGFLLERLHLGGGLQILDLGCGGGNLEVKLLEQGKDCHITAVDRCEEMIGMAKRKCREGGFVSWQVADAHALPFQDETFDVALSANSFHYYEEPKQALMEIRRVLKSKGIFWLLDWCRDFWTMKGLDLFLRWSGKDYHHCYSQSEIRKLLEENFFAVRGCEVRKISPLWGLMCVEAQSP